MKNNTGQPREDSNTRTASIGQLRQDGQDRAWYKTAGAGQLEQDSQDGTVVKKTAGLESCATVLGQDR
jgi:hypothetical protein